MQKTIARPSTLRSVMIIYVKKLTLGPDYIFSEDFYQQYHLIFINNIVYKEKVRLFLHL